MTYYNKNKKKNSSIPLVSIVMPSLNQIDYIENAIRSVLEQSYSNLELIIVDGLSTDGTQDKIFSLQEKYSNKLKWISREDSGPAEAINTAIGLSQGEIIGWLNSDDLYAKDAVTRAVEYFLKYPTHQMSYGSAQLINSQGFILRTYPTKSPSLDLNKFLVGSYICQPTVFIRREVFDAVGLLDEKLKTAFDYDLWIRISKAFPRRIGMIKEIQAYSRIHGSCITHSSRRQVSLEGMYINAKEFGSVPEHWFWTHIDEICANYLLGRDSSSLVSQVESFFNEAKKYFNQDQLINFINRLKSDWRIKLSNDFLYATVHSDGWVTKRVLIKYRWIKNSASAILIHCNAPWPITGELRLKISQPNGVVQQVVINAPGSFILRLELSIMGVGGCNIWLIETVDGFIPAKHLKKSLDNRKLAFQIHSLLEEK